MPSRVFAAAAVLVVIAGTAGAKDYPVRITAARVGLPLGGQGKDSGAPSSVLKFAAWAPVYLDLEVTGTVSGPCEIAVESADPDEITTTLTVPIPLGGVAPGMRVSAADLGAIAYLRPAGGGEVAITVRHAGGGDVSEPFRVRSLRPRDSLSYVFLTLGGPVPGIELPKPAAALPETASGLRGGRVEAAELTRFNDLPDRWFGYEAADVVLLNTAPGAEELLTRLFGDNPAPSDVPRREAFVEWLRRGGRLVVSVGANAGLVAKLPGLQAILPFAVDAARPTRPMPKLVLYWSARESSQASTLSGALEVKGAMVSAANLAPRPNHPAQVLIPTRERLKDVKDAIAAQAPLGLGRVTVVGFDLDRPPFTEFEQRVEFWDWVLREGGASAASAGSDGKPKPGGATPTEEEDELAVALRTHSDTFDDVPVVSFGWVALLIGLYLLLIGPVEYFVLKRLFGRLELTWITFPIIVLTVSIAAYFSAQALKGRELKVNKMDVVDVDLASGRIYGSTWFTIFSPRIDTYTLGVTPGDGWAKEAEATDTTLTWVGSPRGGRASLLRRSYEYNSGENALVNVPVQVWSTKAFAANWSGRLAPTTVESRLEHPPGDPNAVFGTFVNRLPVPVLTDCVAFYAGTAYPIPGGTIRPGETIRLVLDKGVAATQWLQKESRLDAVMRSVPTYAARAGAKAAPPPGTAGAPAVDESFPFWGVLFHESSLSGDQGVIPRNASLRRLDQSWRLDPAHRDEVILVGRATPPQGPAETTLSGPASPSRLWLKGVPGAGAERTPITGTGRQETWVRVYLPVR